MEYVTLPDFDEGRLRLEGKVKNGARFGVGDTIAVQIFYDPPPHSLTPGSCRGRIAMIWVCLSPIYASL